MAHLAEATGIPSIDEPGRSFESAIAALLVPVARAIAVAHELGLVHRDVKPSNILMHRDGRLLVADFGLAKGDGDPALSLTGEPLGTPYYMSPEQAELSSQVVDARSDVYSLGVTLYECLSGARPFEGASALAVLEAIKTGCPRGLRAVAPSRSPAAEAVVARAMARRKEDRYGSAIDLAADLAALAENRQTQAVAERGGLFRRTRAALAALSRGYGYEYVSPRRFLGIPLVHVNYRKRSPGERRLRVAKGWLALSDVAFGGLAIAPLAVGLLGLGAFGVGLLGLGGFALGGYSFGGISMGVFATGGMAIGLGAAGGMSAGYCAFGGLAFGQHIVTGAEIDPVAVDFLVAWMPWVQAVLP